MLYKSISQKIQENYIKKRGKRKYKIDSSSDEQDTPIVFNTDESNFLYSKRINRTNDFIGKKRIEC